MSFDRADINAPMGMEKRAHIRTMLSTEKGSALWQQAQGRAWTEADVNALYESFEETLRQVVAEYSHPIPGVPETVEELRKMGLKIGSTTGYTSEIMSLVAPVAAREGYAPDCIITPDQTDGLGRPTPFMLFACMQRLRVWPVSRVVKVGDTISDISERQERGRLGHRHPHGLQPRWARPGRGRDAPRRAGRGPQGRRPQGLPRGRRRPGDRLHP